MTVSYTLVVTSCKRFDLLQETLKSFARFADIEPADVVVIEDSNSYQVEMLVHAIYPKAKVIVNGLNIGQMLSIDRAYQEVQTPYIFHCEDDWRFFRSGFITETAKLLDALPKVSLISLRDKYALNRLLHDLNMQALNDISYFVCDPRLHPEYFGYSFNPGLRRASDAQTIGPFAILGGEADVSYAFKKAGFAYAFLKNAAVEHIGDGRHVDDPAQPLRRRDLKSRLMNSIKKRMKRLKRMIIR